MKEKNNRFSVKISFDMHARHVYARAAIGARLPTVPTYYYSLFIGNNNNFLRGITPIGLSYKFHTPIRYVITVIAPFLLRNTVGVLFLPIPSQVRCVKVDDHCEVAHASLGNPRRLLFP